MLQVSNTVLVLIDVQGKLATQMYDSEVLVSNLVKLVKGLQLLDVPILWNEQYPKGLGPTVPELADLLQDTQEPIVKDSFSSYGAEPFATALTKLDRKQVIVAGIEAHVCVYQTAMDLTTQGYEVEVVVDSVSSRVKENKEIALARLRDQGIRWTSTEMVLFELQKVAKGKRFKKLLEIIK